MRIDDENSLLGARKRDGRFLAFISAMFRALHIARDWTSACSHFERKKEHSQPAVVRSQVSGSGNRTIGAAPGYTCTYVPYVSVYTGVNTCDGR